MNLRKSGLAAAAFGAAVALGWSPQAHAGAAAYASLDIFNFTLTNNGTGQPLTAADFATLPPANNNTAASAFLFGFGNASGSDPVDVAHQCVGNCAGIGSNNFAQQSFPGSASFSRADALLTGSLLAPGGARAQGVAEIQLVGSFPVDSTSDSDLGTTVTFSFALQNDMEVRADFSAIPILNVQTDALGGSVIANINFSISVMNADTGELVFEWAPDGDTNDGNSAFDEITDECSLNAPRSTSLPNRNFTYNPAADQQDQSCDYSGVVSLLGGVNYTLTITQEQTVRATSVPEPGTLAILASSLIGLGVLARRRRRRA